MCDQCSTKHYLFGHGGVQAAANELQVPFLGEIPFVQQIMDDSDRGVPPALRGDATLPAAKPYYELAERIHDTLMSFQTQLKSNNATTSSYDTNIADLSSKTDTGFANSRNASHANKSMSDILSGPKITFED